MFILFIAGAVIAYNLLTNQTEGESSLTIQENTQTETREKQPAPDFTVTDEKGNPHKLSDFKGKPIVLNFWASWCPPCKEEMPVFNKVYEEMGEDIQFMMVDLTDGQRETVEAGLEYVREEGYTFPVFFDTENEGGITYGITSIPTTIFIDSEGNIVTGVRGALNESVLREAIELIR